MPPEKARRHKGASASAATSLLVSSQKNRSARSPPSASAASSPAAAPAAAAAAAVSTASSADAGSALALADPRLVSEMRRRYVGFQDKIEEQQTRVRSMVEERTRQARLEMERAVKAYETRMRQVLEEADVKQQVEQLDESAGELQSFMRRLGDAFTRKAREITIEFKNNPEEMIYQLQQLQETCDQIVLSKDERLAKQQIQDAIRQLFSSSSSSSSAAAVGTSFAALTLPSHLPSRLPSHLSRPSRAQIKMLS